MFVKSWKRILCAFSIGVLGGTLCAVTAAGEGISALLIPCILLTAGMAVLVPLNIKFNEIFSSVIFVLTPFFTFYLMESLTHDVWTMDLTAQIVNLLFFYLIFLGLLMVFGKVSTALITGNTALAFIGIANYYVQLFRGNPILPWDLQSIGTAMSVTNNYTFEVNYRVLIIVLLFLLINATASKCRAGIKRVPFRLAGAFACMLLIFGGSKLLHNETVTDALLPGGTLFTQWATYRDNGFLVSFMVNLKYMDISEPAGYDVESVVETVAQYADLPEETYVTTPLEKPRKNPNIIVIMNEAFSDLSVIHEFGVTKDYMPFIRSLSGRENTVNGNLFVSVVCGNTANTEFEFLTGSTMAFLPAGSVPYQQYISDELPNLTSILKEQGYLTTAIHPFSSSGWSRNSVYPLLKFDYTYFKNSFRNPEYIRQYISDRSSFQKIIDQYERKNADESVFIFNVTMQNHGGYSLEYDNFRSTVHLTDIENRPGTEQYLSLILESDRAFQSLVEYFAAEEEETVILMFGDHQPTDYVANCIVDLTGKTMDEMTLEEQQTRYTVPFMLWANYDIEEGYYDRISANYLSTVLMDAAGLQKSDYQSFLSGLKETLPVITANCVADADGSFYSMDEAEELYPELIQEYRVLQYNLLFDSKNRRDEVFTLTK